jgi:ribosomal protein RSM22 (predicted rRNA methylase)
MFFAREAISFPPELANALEKSLWPASSVVGSAVGSSALMRERQEALRKLWPKLAKGRGQAQAGEPHYSFQRSEAEAYAAYYLPANCLKVPLALEEAFLAGEDPLPAAECSWLDLGTGPGTAYWGLAWWCARRGKKARFTGWDQSPHFQSIARNLAASAGFATPASFVADRSDPLELIRKTKPTHVSFVNSLAEIYPDLARRRSELGKILRELRALKQADGRERFLLVVEPGSRASSRELAELKDQLQAESLGQVLFPCLDSRLCGALVNPQDWCHEEVACDFPDWLNELGAGAGLRKESMLFSYALMHATPTRQPRPTAGALRIVSQRLERKGQVECYLCTAHGKRPVRVQRSKTHEANEFFLRSVRGDCFRSAEIGDKNDLERADALFPASPESVFAPRF